MLRREKWTFKSDTILHNHKILTNQYQNCTWTFFIKLYDFENILQREAAESYRVLLFSFRIENTSISSFIALNIFWYLFWINDIGNSYTNDTLKRKLHWIEKSSALLQLFAKRQRTKVYILEVLLDVLSYFCPRHWTWHTDLLNRKSGIRFPINNC